MGSCDQAAHAQSAAIAVDGFYTHLGTAGNMTGTTAVASSGRQNSSFRKRDHAASSASELMEIDHRRPRLSLTRPTVSLSTRQPNGKIRFSPQGTVKGQDIPDSVQPIISRLREDLSNLPSNVFVPQQRRDSDGRMMRPHGVCWVKGCTQNHNWGSCPRLVNYLLEHPNMDAPPNEAVRLPPPPARNERPPFRNDRR